MKAMNEKVMFSSKTDEWATPQSLFDRLDGGFHFTLDAAANEGNHKCERYYTPEMDGLSLPWEGTVWCNPPYGRQIGKWVRKAYYEHMKHNNTIVLLLPARTDTKWFHEYILGRAQIFFIKGRLTFGSAKNPAPFPSMLVVYQSQFLGMRQ